MNQRPGFRAQRRRTALLGQDETDWRAYVIVRGQLPETLDVVSLGDRYFLSLGAHATHTNLLMDAGHADPLTVDAALTCCAIVAYAIDAPVFPAPGGTQIDAVNAPAFDSTLRGTVFSSAGEYANALDGVAESASVYMKSGFPAASSVTRTLTRQDSCLSAWIHYPWPSKPAVRRGMGAYALATLSVAPSTRILNFWRAIEAVASTRHDRERLFADLEQASVAPVWSDVRAVPFDHARSRHRRFDASRFLRRVALTRRDALLKAHGNVSQALDHLYQAKRGKAAHADKVSLEYDFAAFLGDHLRDGELLRFMARAAIEHAW